MLACSSGPYQEPELSTDENRGPGVFTGESGEFSLSDFFSKEKKTQDKAPATTSSANMTPTTVTPTNPPAIDNSSFEDFELFKAWRQAKDANSQTYQEFQEWRAYQQYLRQRSP